MLPNRLAALPSKFWLRVCAWRPHYRVAFSMEEEDGVQPRSWEFFWSPLTGKGSASVAGYPCLVRSTVPETERGQASMVAMPGIFIDFDDTLEKRELFDPLFWLTRFGAAHCLAQLRGICIAQPGAAKCVRVEQ